MAYRKSKRISRRKGNFRKSKKRKGKSQKIYISRGGIRL